jgi:hypothetical protein
MSTIRANAITDAAGGNTTTINGITPALATQAEAQTGTDNTKLMTPLRVTEAVLSDFNVTGAAPLYACRAWVNFNGTGTVAIRASGNVSSITDNGVGLYTINFTTAMPDVNYATMVTGSLYAGSLNSFLGFEGQQELSLASKTTSSVKIGFASSTAYGDAISANVVIFR